MSGVTERDRAGGHGAGCGLRVASADVATSARNASTAALSNWFLITMRLTLLCQYARGVAHHNEAAGGASGRTGADQVAALARQSASSQRDNQLLPG